LSQLVIVEKKEYRKEAKYLAGSHTDKVQMASGNIWLPLGSVLSGIKAGILKQRDETGKYKGKKLKIKEMAITPEAVKNAALRYMHAPYLWGGRSVAGIDCSGLSQMAFRLCNQCIPRDASQQSKKNN